jgi:hypothetical protein
MRGEILINIEYSWFEHERALDTDRFQTLYVNLRISLVTSCAGMDTTKTFFIGERNPRNLVMVSTHNLI